MAPVQFMRDENFTRMIRYWSVSRKRWCTAYSVEEIPDSELTTMSTAQCLDMLDHLEKNR